MGRGLFEGWHLILLLVIVFLLFGASRLPAAAKSMGEALKIFKKEMKDISDDGKTEDTAAPATPEPPATSATTPAADPGPIPGMIDPHHPKA
ncbi:MAG: twin-arginine translocase TatA/TatE family subunit [Promicromonosporaceae bacterium]|nr:twin-arginine translocase TatA/TatE family subunit [Promicromonosporaceae bacterium]